MKNKIIAALDVSTAEEADKIINDTAEFVGAYKIGLQLFTAVGASFVREQVAAGNKIFLDLKFHDIPNTVAKAGIEAARMGVWMFNIHAIGGGEMIERTISEVGEVCDKENTEKPLIIGVTVLTSSDEATLAETGIGGKTDEQVLRLAKLSAKYGLDGVVASPLEIKPIRQNIENKDFLIVTPGIRNKTVATFDDQKRVMTANEAVGAGADYLVIGRPITQASDRREAIEKILNENGGE